LAFDWQNSNYFNSGKICLYQVVQIKPKYPVITDILGKFVYQTHGVGMHSEFVSIDNLILFKGMYVVNYIYRVGEKRPLN